jgi:Tfp pilus assembly protein PilF
MLKITRVAVPLLLIWMLISLGACNAKKASTNHDNNPFKNVQSEFVGDKACVSCHEDLYNSYQSHGMAQSFYALTSKNVVEDFNAAPIKDPKSNYEYRVYQEGGKYYQEEYEMEAGQKIHTAVREMKYVMGSGTAARTYLTEENGRYYELPLTWYTQAKKWAFSPDYEDYNQRFTRLIPSRCMACHNSFPKEEKDVLGKFSDVKMGIGCERCHGPGSLHVEERLADPDFKGTDYTIVNPKRLPLDRRLDVCQQCHLTSSVSLLRDGREAFSFRPSEPLSTHLALYKETVDEQNGQINVISHADRMRQSACFRALEHSAKQMDCVTCHNPHQGFRKEGDAYFNLTCIKCHEIGKLGNSVVATAKADHQSSSNCISCHMPKTESDAPHSAFTDHFVRIVKNDKVQYKEQSKGEVKLTPYFKDESENADVYEGIAYITFGRQKNNPNAVTNGISKLETALANKEGLADSKYMLGLAMFQEGRVNESIPWLEKAIALKGNSAMWLNTLAQAYESGASNPTKAEELYRKALAIQPKASTIRVNLGRFLEAQGRGGEALALYQEAAQEDPYLEEAQYNLGSLYLRQNQAQQAEVALHKAYALNPNHVKTLTNLGVLWAQQGKEMDAKRLFERALRLEPNNLDALSNLATFYAQKNRLNEAMPLLEKVTQLSPTNATAMGTLSAIYFNVGKVNEAKQMAQRALQYDPNNVMARQVMSQ